MCVCVCVCVCVQLRRRLCEQLRRQPLYLVEIELSDYFVMF
jgi:hypothetical protein